jgi:phage tail-like protein
MATYPLAKFHFSVEGVGERIGFTEVTGLDIQVEPIEYREGSAKEFSKIKMPGMPKYSNLTLKRGTVLADSDFYKWLTKVQALDVDRRDLTINLLNENHEPVMTWKVISSFPIKVQASDLKADGNEVAIETIEVAHEGLSLVIT